MFIFSKYFIIFALTLTTKPTQTMKVTPISVISTMSGKLNPNQNVVFRTRNGKTSAYTFTPSTQPRTTGQLQGQTLFTQATALADADMKNPTAKSHWQEICTTSHGKWKSPRGAAYSHYYQQLKNQTNPNYPNL